MAEHSQMLMLIVEALAVVEEDTLEAHLALEPLVKVNQVATEMELLLAVVEEELVK